jgi:hypothetical protein
MESDDYDGKEKMCQDHIRPAFSLQNDLQGPIDLCLA